MQIGNVVTTVEKWMDPQPCTVEERTIYIAGLLYWSWMFGSMCTKLGGVDEYRLGLPKGDISRLALAGEDRYWKPVEDHPNTYSPTGELIRAFRSGTFPGLEISPIVQVRRQLAAPRYEVVLKSFQKAVERLG